MHDCPPSLFFKILKERFLVRRQWAQQQNIAHYRLFNYERALPMAIDLYDNKYLHISISQNKLANFPTLDYIDAAMRATGTMQDRIFIKERQKLSNGEQYAKPSQTAFPLWISEDLLELKVDLSSYIDTGLFLDHRLLRSLISHISLGKNVLNLFCYTGGFSLYAAQGGAESVKSLDLSHTYLQWAQENFAHNHIIGKQYIFERCDVLDYLNKPDNRNYDIIVLDPPIFSNSHTMEKPLKIERDYIWLIQQCLRRLSKNGVLFFSTPYTQLQFDSRKISGITQEITKKLLSEDFSQGKLPHRLWQITHHAGALLDL
jgi:23S rRNA G2069 N7-methylase RlmK/C1962 C5-methylase RlmI